MAKLSDLTSSKHSNIVGPLTLWPSIFWRMFTKTFSHFLPLFTSFKMISHDSNVSVNEKSPAVTKTTQGGHNSIHSTVTSNVANGTSAPMHHIWLVTGPAGCGKSTLAEHMAKELGLPYLEGDEFHPQANIDKMANGIPLTDADRWDWLIKLREESMKQLNAGAKGVVLTCSALKRKYRDVIRVAPYYSHDVQLHFIYLHAPESVLLERVGARKGHYMGANMVHSQFSILEPPAPEETDVISVDVSPTMDEVQKDALAKVHKKMEEFEA